MQGLQGGWEGGIDKGRSRTMNLPAQNAENTWTSAVSGARIVLNAILLFE